MNHNAEPQTDISLETTRLETAETHQPTDHPSADTADIADIANIANIDLAAAVDDDADGADDDNDAEGNEADETEDGDDDSDEVKAETEDSEDASDTDDSDSDDSDVDDSDIEEADVDDQGPTGEGFVQIKAEAEGDEDPADDDSEDTEDTGGTGDTDDADHEVTAEADPAGTGVAQIQAESADEAETEDETGDEDDAEDDEAAGVGSDDSESSDGDDDEDPHGEFDENGQRVIHSAIDPLDDEEDPDHDSDNNEDADDPANMAWTVDDLLASLEQDVHQHGLQCAYELEQQFPNDRELQIAGLVHDVAHRISSEAMHGIVAADLVRPLYGDRVASLVELHVDAKRYLVTVDPNYHAILSPESVHTLMLQGSTMDAAEHLAFENNHHFGDAVTLRRADDAAKVPGRSVPDLTYWEPILRTAAVNEEIRVAA